MRDTGSDGMKDVLESLDDGFARAAKAFKQMQDGDLQEGFNRLAKLFRMMQARVRQYRYELTPELAEKQSKKKAQAAGT